MVVSASERAEIFTFLRRKHTILFNSLLVKLIFVDTCPCIRYHDMAFLMTNFTDQKTRNFNNSIIKDCERAERASQIFFAFLRLKHTFIFNSLLVNHICRCCPCVHNTDIALFMTSYTDQETRNLRTSLNDCERASRKFSPFPVLSFLVNHIFVGAIPYPPPPPSGYTLVGLMQSDNLFACKARGENGRWMHKL